MGYVKEVVQPMRNAAKRTAKFVKNFPATVVREVKAIKTDGDAEVYRDTVRSLQDRARNGTPGWKESAQEELTQLGETW